MIHKIVIVSICVFRKITPTPIDFCAFMPGRGIHMATFLIRLKKIKIDFKKEDAKFFSKLTLDRHHSTQEVHPSQFSIPTKFCTIEVVVHFIGLTSNLDSNTILEGT